MRGDPTHNPAYDQKVTTDDPWYEDLDEVIAFARWYFVSKVSPKTVINVFEKPWKWNSEHDEYVADKEGE